MNGSERTPPWMEGRGRARETGVRGTRTHTERQRDVPLVLVLHLLLPEIEISHQPANPEQE